MKNPIIFGFNMQRQYFEHFGLRQFENIQKSLKDKEIFLFPIINDGASSIEQRAKYIQKFFPQFLEDKKINNVNVFAYSLSGLDFRLFISQLNGDQNIQSLTTFCTPNKGSYLLSEYNQGKVKQQHIEPICRILGLEMKSLTEINNENIRDFNSYAFNSSKVKYFSIGGEKMSSHTSDLFRETNEYVFNKKEYGWMSDNDGLFAEDEIKWGQHLINFDYDHAEFAGFGKIDQSQKIYRFASDNISYNFN